MAYFLFIDESGQDHHDSPYEVLAGVSILDQDLWNLIRAVHQLELKYFGLRYRDTGNEIKARKFLKRKTFRLANQLPAIQIDKRTELAKKALNPANQVTKEGLTALSQAKLAYVKELFEVCIQFRCKIFASVVSDPSILPDEDNMLRRDYIYLFERYFYFLEDKRDAHQGIVVFDELDKSASHIVVSQMDNILNPLIRGEFDHH